MVMRYEEEILIDKKIFKKEDIVSIAKLISEQAQNDCYLIEYIAHFPDNKKIYSDNLDIFDSDRFNRKVCKQIDIIYISKKFNSKIYVRLYNSLFSNSKGSIEISSEDKVWSNAIVKEFKEILSEVEDRKFIINTTIEILTLVFALIQGLIFCYYIHKFLPDIFTDDNKQKFNFIVQLAVIFLNMYFLKHMKKAYPNIEFSFGPEHLNKSKKIRNFLLFASQIVFDIVLVYLG